MYNQHSPNTEILYIPFSLSYRESSEPPMYLYSWRISVWPNHTPSTNGHQKRRHRLKVLALKGESLEQRQQICRGFFSPGEVLQDWPLGNLLEMQNIRGHNRTSESNSVYGWAIGALTRPPGTYDAQPGLRTVGLCIPPQKCLICSCFPPSPVSNGDTNL